MPIYGTEHLDYNCSHLDQSVQLSLHFFNPRKGDKKYLSFSCDKKFECGVYLWREHTAENYDWSKCPTMKEYKIGDIN